MSQTYHILFWRSTNLTSKGLCGLQSPEIKRKVVTARRGDATKLTRGVKTQNRTDEVSEEGTENSCTGQLNRWMRRKLTKRMNCCELSFSIHSIFYLTRQPFHALHKEENNYVKLVGFGGVEREGSNQRYFRKTSKSSVEFYKRPVQLFYTDVFEIKINCSAPTSLRPSPVTALLAQMCHGLSINLSRPRVCDTFTLDIASLHTILQSSVKLS